MLITFEGIDGCGKTTQVQMPHRTPSTHDFIHPWIRVFVTHRFLHSFPAYDNYIKSKRNEDEDEDEDEDKRGKVIHHPS